MNRYMTPERRVDLVVLAVTTMMTGCVTTWQPDSRAIPIAAAPDMYQELRPANDGNMRTGAWWRSFQDPQLDTLIATALDENFELRGLAARIEQARQLLKQANAGIFPRVDGRATYGYDWTTLADSRAETWDESSSLGLLLGWEIDVWQRLRSRRNARDLERRAAVGDLLGAKVFLSAAVADVYFGLVEQHRQLELIRDQIGANRTLLDLTRLRFSQGQSSIVDVLQQQEQLEATLVRVPVVEARLGQLTHALDTLLGGPGPTVTVTARNVSLPALPAVGFPGDLLVNRPDLRAARNRIAALDYGIAEAIAERLPRLTIGGNLSVDGDPGADRLVENGFIAVDIPLFDAGRREAEVGIRRAAVKAATADFSALFLAAVRDVETALVGERKQAEHIRLLENRIATARRLLTETRNRYSQGLTDYLPVLTALTTVQELERDMVESHRQLLTMRVMLHRALGGPLDVHTHTESTIAE